MRHMPTMLFVSGILLAVTSCSSKSQYSRDTAPLNPDPAETTLIAPEWEETKEQSSNDSSQIGDTDGVQQGAWLQDPDEILRRVDSWNQVPVTWGKTVGNIVVGETSCDSWYNEVNAYLGVVSFPLSFARESCNSENNGQGVIPTTVRAVRIYNGYLGLFSFTGETGETATIKLGESFSKLGFFQRAGKTYSPESPELSPGYEFFKNFYNTQIQGLAESTEYNCFEEDYCRFRPYNDGLYISFEYDTATGASGELFIEAETDIFVQAYFDQPSQPGPGHLAKASVSLDLSTGIFADEEGSQLLALGAVFADKTLDLELPEEGVTWFSWPMNFIAQYLGMNLFVEKTQLHRLADETYYRPLGGDFISGVYLDKNYSGQVTFPTVDGSVITVPFRNVLGDLKEELADSEKVAYLQEFLGNMRKQLEASLVAQGGRILSSRIEGFGVPSLYASYTYSLIYQRNAEGPAVSMNYRVLRRTAEADLDISNLTSLESSLKKISVSEDGVSIGSLKMGDTLPLSDLEAEDEVATWEYQKGQKVRVTYNRDGFVKFYTPADDYGNVTLEERNLSSISLDGTTIYLSKVCDNPEPCRYEVASIMLDHWYEQDTPPLYVCDGLIKLTYGMSLGAFEKAVKGAHCLIQTGEDEVGTGNKTTFYLPKDQLVVMFLGENNNTLGSLRFY